MARFSPADCQAYSRKIEIAVLLLVGSVSLTSLGVLLHSIWVLRP